MHVGHQIVCAIALSAGVKKSKLPDPPEPPKVGWNTQAAEQEATRAARRARKARNWIRRYGAQVGLTAA